LFPYQYTSAIIGIILGLIIFFLIKHDRLHVKFAFFWFIIAVAVIFLGVFPKFFDKIGNFLGVSYPPVLLLVLALSLVLLKLLRTDIERSKLEQRIKELTQRMAYLEGIIESKEHEKQ
jgi:hypothetical protein